MIKFDEDKQKKQVEELHLAEEESVVKILSKRYDLPYLELSSIPINTDALRLIPEDMARKAGVAGFRLIGKKIDVALTHPKKEETIMVLKELTQRGYKPMPYMVSQRSVRRAWERYAEISFAKETEAGVLEIAHDQLASFIEELKSFADLQNLIKESLLTKKKYHVSQLLEILLAGGITTGASDIHIEPEEESVKLRLRLDGVLQDLLFVEHKIYILMLSRIKLLSGLKLNVKNDAQDGRFSIKIGDADIEIRTSIIPGAYGESIVMRILNPSTLAVTFKDLGMHPNLIKIIEREIKKPNGMILNTGPTGSGKTTALYAFLKEIQTSKIKIITIEDPIEYHLPGITQTQVDKKSEYNFAQGVRAVVRQDPDVIMVGEIRDSDTAKTAIHAALTGHLVLSTLHTNNAAGAIPRLIDLSVNSKVISSAVNVAMAQRLVRRLCKVCKKKHEPTPEEKKIIDNITKHIPANYKTNTDGTYTLWEAGSCVECNNTGYKGRIGIFEAVLMDGNIEVVIKENPSEREIKKAAEPQGIPTMRQDGMLKAFGGITSLEELARVVGLE